MAGWSGELLALFASIRDLGAADVLPQVITWIDDDDKTVAAAASEAVAGVLARLPIGDLASLDSILRGSWTNDGSRGRVWTQIDPESLDRWLASGCSRAVHLNLVSMHPSGYVRQAAVRRLAERDDGSEVPYLLLRLNDWVSPVREAAQFAIQKRLHPGYAPHLIHALPLVNRLQDCRRYDHTSFIAAVADVLRAPAARPALLEGLDSVDRSVRRTCFGLAVEGADIPQGEFLRSLVRHADSTLRLWAMRIARSKFDVVDYLDLIRALMSDRFIPVRREALVGLVERCPDLAVPVLMDSLLDAHVSIREVARYYLKKFEGFDARSFYRDEIHSGSPERLPQAIVGLGETGIRADAGLVVQWLTHRLTKVRRAAVKALGQLDGDGHSDELLRALGDERSAVCRAAMGCLRSVIRLVAVDHLWEIFERTGHSHGRRHALTLLAGSGKWAGLPYLIRACRDHDTAIAALARGHLRDWLTHFNRTFARPSVAELQLARAALEASTPTLGPDFAELLRFHLEGW